ncbi:MAG: hypothetical protein B6U76_00755 [Desulfurococcales archaeon ex4484_217_2]|nr:MAG: hypothetical protein B6U76_00755 [Desulfurococcales archaeon ex4484_217_2]
MNGLKRLRRLSVVVAERLGLYVRRYLEYFRIVVLMLAVLVRHMKRNCVVMELGCANGWLTRSIARHCGLAIGIDIAPSRKWTRDRGINVEFIVADARFLPIRSNVISFVVALSLLEHVARWSMVVSEAFRVLKRSALLVVQIPNLMYFIEPHTHFPLLGFLPNKLRTTLAQNMCCEVHFDCTIRNVVKVLENYDFKYWVIFYYHTFHILLKLFAPSYFIIALKRNKGYMI